MNPKRIEFFALERKRLKSDELTTHAGGVLWWLMPHFFAVLRTLFGEIAQVQVVAGYKAAYQGSPLGPNTPTWVLLEMWLAFRDHGIVSALFEGGKATIDLKSVRLITESGTEEINLLADTISRRQSVNIVIDGIIRRRLEHISLSLCESRRVVEWIAKAEQQARWISSYSPGQLSQESVAGILLTGQQLDARAEPLRLVEE